VWQDEIQPCPYQKALHRIRPINDSIDPHFVMYHLWLAAISGTFLDSNAKTTIAHLPAVRLAKLPIVLPPLSEQRRIAGVLREQMASVASSRRSAEAQLEAAQFLLAAYLRAVFNSPEAQAWPRKKFEDVAVLQRGHDLPLKNRVPGAYPVMTSSGMVGTHNEYRSKGPGVVTGRSGSVGRVHFVEQDYWPHNTALYVKDFKGSDPRYTYYLLQWVNVKRVSSGTGVPTLDRKEVHKLIVAHPDISDQRRIAAELTERLAGVERLRRSLAEQLEAIEKLPAALLRRAFNGEL
jgi:type I restriction enzyme S subunit